MRCSKFLYRSKKTLRMHPGNASDLVFNSAKNTSAEITASAECIRSRIEILRTRLHDNLQHLTKRHSLKPSLSHYTYKECSSATDSTWQLYPRHRMDASIEFPGMYREKIRTASNWRVHKCQKHSQRKPWKSENGITIRIVEVCNTKMDMP